MQAPGDPWGRPPRAIQIPKSHSAISLEYGFSQCVSLLQIEPWIVSLLICLVDVLRVVTLLDKLLKVCQILD